MRIPPTPSIHDVRRFWESHPLCALESPYEVGTPEFFRWHNRVRDTEVEAFALHLYEFEHHAGEQVLDVGCGVGWLCARFARNGADVVGLDLTRRAVELTRVRLELNRHQAALLQGSAEQLPFQTGSFEYVTCAGVLHHTPDPRRAAAEIFRVLKPGGKALVSLYYKNWFLSSLLWPISRFAVRRLPGGLAGRRTLRHVKSVDEFVRIYDGDENPLGKGYARRDALALFEEFAVERIEVHYFPMRFLQWGRRVPRVVHRFLDRFCGTMIYIRLCKPATGSSRQAFSPGSEAHP